MAVTNGKRKGENGKLYPPPPPFGVLAPVSGGELVANRKQNIYVFRLASTNTYIKKNINDI